MTEYSNSQMENLIDEWIHNRRYRKVLKMYFIDGDTIEFIAADEEIDRTPRQVNRIIENCSAILEKHLQMS